MSGSGFLDTNVLVYAVEEGGPDSTKSAQARELIRETDFTVSVQVLGEFYRAVTSRRRVQPMSHKEAVCWVQHWKSFNVCGLSREHVDLALELADRYVINYFDALILSTARFARCDTVYSEDLNAGQDYGGVEVVNPFQ